MLFASGLVIGKGEKPTISISYIGETAVVIGHSYQVGYFVASKIPKESRGAQALSRSATSLRGLHPEHEHSSRPPNPGAASRFRLSR